MRWFRGSEEASVRTPTRAGGPGKSIRRSTGFAEFTRTLKTSGAVAALDLGPTSPANIEFLINFGGRVYNEDVLRASTQPDYQARQEDGGLRLDAEKFFADNLNHPESHFDAILAWDIPDFLDESLVKPMVQRIHKILRKGGILLAFFHTKDAGPDSPHCRYRIVDRETLELEPGPEFRLQRVFNNRHIENLFKEFSSLKFFLARDSVREVLVVR